MSRVCVLSQKGRERIEAIASILPKKFNSFFILFLDIQKNYQLLYLPLIVETICQNI